MSRRSFHRGDLRLAVNRHAERGEWDFEALKLEFEELIVLGAPLEVSERCQVAASGLGPNQEKSSLACVLGSGA
jgi:hypothetical protein